MTPSNSETTETNPLLFAQTKYNSIDENTPEITRLKSKKHFLILEIPAFLLSLAVFLSNGVFQNQILHQVCMVKLQYNETECEPLLGLISKTSETNDIESLVQPIAAKIILVKSLSDNIVPAIVCLFVGSWSDKYGRRPILLITYAGIFLHYGLRTLYALIALKVAISPWLMLIDSIPLMLCGGSSGIVTITYCYISDVTKGKETPTRMVFLTISLYAGMILGSYFCTIIYAATSFAFIFFTSTILTLLAEIYIYKFIPESLYSEPATLKKKLLDFFSLKILLDLLRTCFKKRDHNERSIILLSISIITLTYFVIDGEHNVLYLFLRKRFNFTLEDFNLLNTLFYIYQLFASLIILCIFRKIFKLSIISMCALALISAILMGLISGFANYKWQIYLSIACGSLRGLQDPFMRTLLSRIAADNELGRIFAFTTSLNSFTPFISAPLYTTVYTNTLSSFPNAYNFISSLICFIGLINLIFIYVIARRNGSSYIYSTIKD